MEKYQGLSEKEAKKRLVQYGENKLTAIPPPSLFTKFFNQFNDFMILTLLAAAGISLVLSFLKGELDIIDPAIILSIVIVNAVMGVFQEAKAERSLASLERLAAPQAIVRRGGVKKIIPSALLVPGDVVLLETGNTIPADSKVVISINLSCEESALTGETIPQEKTPHASDSREALVFSGTTVATGHGEAIVTSTGSNTEFGKIAELLTYEKTPDTPLQKKLNHTGKVLGILALFICILIFIIGIVRSQPIFTMFMTSVSLAVAAIPEGLPAIVTIMLSLGVERMAKRKAIIRNLPAVETLGSATVICSDKTGTLTENNMKITRTFTYDHSSKLKRYGVLCNNEGIGLEQALIQGGGKEGIYREKELLYHPLLDEISFDSSRKRMTTLHKDGKYFLSITKGAPEMILDISSSYLTDEGAKPMTTGIRRSFMESNKSFAADALRVLAIAYRNHSVKPRCTPSSLENNLTLVGLIGFIDPPRSEAIKAVAECKRAGIRPVMITGDHALTASAVGKLLGISKDETAVLTGNEIDHMSDEELFRNIYNYPIFARVSPTNKMRLVKAFQKHGEIVAMTGDGVNDAPALKVADIGCAMGRGGTDVAKNAADMILADDNFATIVSAVEEGRGIFENIKKSIFFLLSCNIGEIMTIFVSILLGLASPLLPVQLLFINLVTDSFPAVSLGLETPEKDIMSHPPRASKKGMFADGAVFKILCEGVLIGSLALLAYTVGSRFSQNGVVGGTTMCFAVLSLSQLMHAFNMRSAESL
ncbi:MAG: cation-translocating P-type ATPase, partial [Lachnoclostridium sp.]|nr:cation-translocating P-type ATPase [Lachnoclostridium sp.]